MALINGEGYSFASLTVSMLGNPFVAGFKAINFDTTRAKQNRHGAQGLPVERTRGQINFTGSITLTAKEVLRIIAAAGNLPLHRIPPFSLAVEFANGTDPVQTVVLDYVEFTSNNFTAADGDEAIDVELPLVIGGIRYA